MNKSNLKPIYTDPDEPKGHTGWAIDDPNFKAKKLEKPNFKKSVVKSEKPDNVKKRVAEINERKKKPVEKKLSFVAWLHKITKP